MSGERHDGGSDGAGGGATDYAGDDDAGVDHGDGDGIDVTSAISARFEGLGGLEGPWTPGPLVTVRADPRRRAPALLAAGLVGLGLAGVHWLGLVAAGGLVGLVSRTVPRAVLAGGGVGVLAVALTVLAGPQVDPGELLGLTPPAYVTIVAGLVLPVWGSLVRGVI